MSLRSASICGASCACAWRSARKQLVAELGQARTLALVPDDQAAAQRLLPVPERTPDMAVDSSSAQAAFEIAPCSLTVCSMSIIGLPVSASVPRCGLRRWESSTLCMLRR